MNETPDNNLVQLFVNSCKVITSLIGTIIIWTGLEYLYTVRDKIKPKILSKVMLAIIVGIIIIVAAVY